MKWLLLVGLFVIIARQSESAAHDTAGLPAYGKELYRARVLLWLGTYSKGSCSQNKSLVPPHHRQFGPWCSWTKPELVTFFESREFGLLWFEYAHETLTTIFAHYQCKS